MSWRFIAKQTLAAPASSITFSSGLEGYAFYRLTVYVANGGSGTNILLRLNGDSAGNYDRQWILGNSTTVSGARNTAQNQIGLLAATLSANEEASTTVLIAKPAAGVPAQVIGLAGLNASPQLTLVGGEWGNTSDAISSVSLVSNVGDFAADTSALLEGLVAP